MKLDRNINKNGRGKYALIKLRVDLPIAPTKASVYCQVHQAAIDYGDTLDTAFFVIRLKDKYAAAALRAYAMAAEDDDMEWAREVHALANIASNHPHPRQPD